MIQKAIKKIDLKNQYKKQNNKHSKKMDLKKYKKFNKKRNL